MRLKIAFTANPKEITVNNFASTFDNADHSSQMALAPSDATRNNSESNRIEFAFSRIAQLYTFDLFLLV